MALIVNPDQSSGSGESRDRKVGIGRKILMPVGIDHRESRAGNKMASVRFICLKDIGAEDDPGDCGAYTWDTFVMTERALWKIAKYAVAVGHHEPFDAENEAEFQKVLTMRPVLAVMEIEKGTDGEERVRAREYSKYTGALDPEWDKLIEIGEERHAGYRKWKASQQSGSRYTGTRMPAASKVSDDEIPF